MIAIPRRGCNPKVRAQDSWPTLCFNCCSIRQHYLPNIAQSVGNDGRMRPRQDVVFRLTSCGILFGVWRVTVPFLPMVPDDSRLSSRTEFQVSERRPG